MASIAPWLSVPDATQALTFYASAFGAIELERLEDDGGIVQVARLAVEGAEFWIQTDVAPGPDAHEGGRVRLILTVDDPDAVFARVVAAGATVVAPVYEGHGWRIGRVVDACGHDWEIGKRL